MRSLTINDRNVYAFVDHDQSDDRFFCTADDRFCSSEERQELIVCKAFHARRCLMLYQLAFPEVEFRACPVVCYGITKDNWYKTEYGIDRVLRELARCGNQFVGDIKSYLL